MVAVEFPVRRDKKPFLEKSQINISRATSNSASEGLWFWCFDNYTYFVRATVIQTSPVCTE